MNVRGLASVVLLLAVSCPCQEREVAPEVPWGARYRGSWRTVVSGKRDQITSSDLSEAIRQIAANPGAAVESADASRRWVAAFSAWMDSAKSGVFQAKSEYTQTELFVCGEFGYYQRNEHAGGYVPGVEYVQGGVMRGVEQKLRTGGLWIERQTFVGMDDVFWQDSDGESLQSVPFLVLVAEEYRLLAGFVERHGEALASEGSFVYSGPTPVIPGVYYPPWFGVGWGNLVLQKKSDGSGVVSIRDIRGGVLQETSVRYGANGDPLKVGKVVYMPFSALVYNQVEVRLVGRDSLGSENPSLKMVAHFPFEAACVVDKRFRSFELPIKTALLGDEAVRDFVGVPREPSVDGDGLGEPVSVLKKPGGQDMGNAIGLQDWLWQFGVAGGALVLFAIVCLRLSRRSTR
jgi:hypothetical protein